MTRGGRGKAGKGRGTLSLSLYIYIERESCVFSPSLNCAVVVSCLVFVSFLVFLKKKNHTVLKYEDLIKLKQLAFE